MTADDLQDLFGEGEGDESDDPAEAVEAESDESDGSASSSDFPLFEDDDGETTDGPEADDASGSTVVQEPDSDADSEPDRRTHEADGEDSDTFGSGTTAGRGATDADSGEPDTDSTAAGGGNEPTSPSQGADVDDEELDSVETTTEPDPVAEDDDSESAKSSSGSPEAPVEERRGRIEASVTTDPSTDEASEAHPDEPRPDASTDAPVDGAATEVDETADVSSAGDTSDERSRSTAARTTTDEPDPDARDAAEPASDGPEAAPTSGPDRLPTGIEALDRAMGGGVPPGRLVVLVADPGVQSGLIVDSVLAQRDTLFVSTDRPDWEVARDIEPGIGSGEVVIRDHTPDSLLLGLDSLLDELGRSSNLVLDSVNELELLPRPRYRSFLSDVKRRLFDTGSIGLLTGVTVGHESARDLTLRRADVVWRLETRTNGKEIENLLSVPKFRGGAAMTETVRVELTDEVRVDTSWSDG